MVAAQAVDREQQEVPRPRRTAGGEEQERERAEGWNVCGVSRVRAAACGTTLWAMMPPAIRAAAAALGLALLPVGAAWDAAGRVFALTWAGRELWTGDAAALSAAASGPVLWGLAVVMAAAAGFALARLAGRRVLFGAGAVAGLLAVAPWVVGFVADRQPGSAPAYLDAEDLLHGLGWALLLLAATGGFLRRDPTPGGAADRPGGGRAGDGGPSGEGDAPAGGRALAPAAVAALLVLLGAELGLGGHPVTNDEASYRYQAELFAAGQVARATAHPEHFTARQVALVPDGEGGARAFSKYPPGHSLVLAPFEGLGARALAAPLLAALAVLLAGRLARRLGVRHPSWAAWLVALSPLFIGVQALALSHSTSMLFCAAFALAALRAVDAGGEGRGGARDALAAGLCLSLAFAARPVTALAVALPFAALAAREGGRGARLAAFAAVGAAPGLALLLAVNHLQTGSALKTAYALYAEHSAAQDRFPHPDWTSTALGHTGYNLARLGVWLHGVGLALLLPLAGVLLRPPRRVLLCVGVPVALLAAYGLHWFQGIPWAGPLYLLEALPFLAALSAAGLEALAPTARARRVALAVALLASGHLLAGHLVAARARIEAREAPRAAAAAAGVERGIVFVPLDAAGLKLFPLPPPVEGAQLVFAADLGPANAALLASLGDPPAYRFDPASGALVELP